MKKLKFMLAAATAIGLVTASQADNYLGSTDFEDLAIGLAPTNGLFKFEGAAGDNESEIVAGVPDIDQSLRPREFREGTQTKILQVSTGTDPLLRKIATDAQDVAGGDIYVDTLVQFTVTPSTDDVTTNAADKLLIYLKEDGNGATNLMVKAAYYQPYDDDEGTAEMLEPRDVAVISPSVVPGQWYRLTVKATVDNGLLVFNIWLDNTQLKLENKLLAGEATGADGYYAAFPSLLGKASTELTAVGFAGEGKVDDLSFTQEDPFFTPVDFTLNTVSGVSYTVNKDTYTFTAPNGSVISAFYVGGSNIVAAAGQTSFEWTATADDAGSVVIVSATKQLTAADHPWYESPYAVVLAQNLPEQTDNYVSAFHGQGQEEYLGLTYSTNPLQFDLYTVDGMNALTEVQKVPVAYADNAGFRGVAISKTLGIAVTLAYGTGTTMYAYPLAGGTPVVVSKPSGYSFDAAAFSPDGKYLFSNALNGESSNQYYVKWSVAVATNGITLTKVGSISAGGRGRSMAYARINGRDLVFGLVDTGKIVVMDMTGDSGWTAADLITNLPALSYGTLCVSGVNATGATPKLTVATSTNNGATKIDVLNVYALTVPSSDAVSATLVKSFDEDALTAAGFGDISDANRYGNTVYVTDDDKTIYFARPDAKLYAAQYGLARIGNTLYDTLKDAVDAADTGDTVTTIGDCVVSNGNTGITFTKGITLVNDHTITIDGANYALRIANGTTTPVTFSGTGSIVWAKGSGSPILVGCNEKKASYGINDFYEGSFVLNGGYLTSTYATAKGGNLVKLEAGTFVMNDGTINGGTRGVKADSEGNDATCVLTINGGTIVNTNSAAIAASTAGNGSSTVTVNGGTFTGKIVGTGMVTIPGLVNGVANTAKFDRDQTAFCASGYETTLDNGWYVVTAVAPSGEDIEPGQQSTNTYTTVEAAEAAVSNMTIAASAAVEAALGDTAAYLANFEKKVVAVSGGYKVEVDLTDAATNTLTQAANADVGAVVEALDAATVSFSNAVPGFYYSIGYGTSLQNIAEPAGTTRVLAPLSGSVTLDMPAKDANATSGFYKVLVNVAPAPAQN